MNLLRRFHWPQSVWFDLGLASIIGFVFTLVVMGPAPLNPRNVSWLTPDAATYYVGWELFRQDPHLHWPLTYTDRVGFPYGESVALFDLNPLLALVLKCLSPLLPEPCQYLGLEVVLCYTLQFFFAVRLFRLNLGRNFLGIMLSGFFFLLSPPLNYRLVGHYALSNHWLLIAALLVFFKAQQNSCTSFSGFVISAVVLAGVSVGVNPYIAFQVLMLLTATVVSLLWQRRLSLWRAVGIMSLLGVTCLIVAYSFGFMIPGGRGYLSSGYRYYSMNMLSPFDPYTYRSIILPRLPQSTSGQYEGFNYLGVGILVLAAIVLVIAFLQRSRLHRPNMRWVFPLCFCCLLLSLMAFSTKVTIGSVTLVDLDPRERLSAYLAPLRATGRLFWLPYYAILMSVLIAPFLLLRRGRANLLVAGMLIFQLVDTRPLLHWVHSTVNEDHPTPLKSPIWRQLGSIHENLIVLPAWQCGPGASPGEAASYRIFGFLAVAQKMRTNSYYSARYAEAARDLHCTESISALTERVLSPDSAYVVSPAVAALIAEGPTGPGKCHDLDRFILCSVKSDFGLSSVLMSPAVRLQNAIVNSGFEDSDYSPWARFQDVNASVTTAQAHSGIQSLAQTAGAGSVYQDITGLESGRRYTISAWMAGSSGASATAQLAAYDPGANLAMFSTPLVPRATWQLVSLSVTASEARTLRLHLFRNQGEGTIYWDDVRIYEEK